MEGPASTAPAPPAPESGTSSGPAPLLPLLLAGESVCGGELLASGPLGVSAPGATLGLEEPVGVLGNDSKASALGAVVDGAPHAGNAHRATTTRAKRALEAGPERLSNAAALPSVRLRSSAVLRPCAVRGAIERAPELRTVDGRASRFKDFDDGRCLWAAQGRRPSRPQVRHHKVPLAAPQPVPTRPAGGKLTALLRRRASFEVVHWAGLVEPPHVSTLPTFVLALDSHF